MWFSNAANVQAEETSAVPFFYLLPQCLASCIIAVVPVAGDSSPALCYCVAGDSSPAFGVCHDFIVRR
jgi:hypothetical protein